MVFHVKLNVHNIFAESSTGIARNNPNSCMYEEKNSESSVPPEDKNMSKELHNLDYVNAADENYDSNRANNSGKVKIHLTFSFSH